MVKDTFSPDKGMDTLNREATLSKLSEPAHDKTYGKTCVTSKDSDQPVYPTNMATVLVQPSLDSREVVEDTCHQQRLWSDCADMQADLSSLVAQVLL